MSFYDDIENNTFWTYDTPLLDLMKIKKYRDLWSQKSSKLNPMDLMRDFLLDFDLVEDWTEYIKMRLELAEVDD